jgi:hypothetical protein
MGAPRLTRDQVGTRETLIEGLNVTATGNSISPDLNKHNIELVTVYSPSEWSIFLTTTSVGEMRHCQQPVQIPLQPRDSLERIRTAKSDDSVVLRK